MKHAFLIMSHTNYLQLDKLLKSMDNSAVDIFLHVDKKSEEYHVPRLQYAGLYKTPRMKVSWGGYSQILCELSLLKIATSTQEYDFYHLITGQDILLQKIDEVLEFFERNKDYNFIHYDTPEKSRSRYERIKYYRPFQDNMPRERSLKSALQNKLLLPIQKLLGVDRTKAYKGVIFKSGSAYFSIRHELAMYVLGQEGSISKWFSATISGDEMFMQTLVYNSEFASTLYDMDYDDDCRGNQRYIDFNKGTPYVWCISDYEELILSGMLIARKFDERTDNEIIEKLYTQVHGVQW